MAHYTRISCRVFPHRQPTLKVVVFELMHTFLMHQALNSNHSSLLLPQIPIVSSVDEVGTQGDPIPVPGSSRGSINTH